MLIFDSYAIIFSTSNAIKSSHAIDFVDPPCFRTIWVFMILFSLSRKKLIHYIVNRVKRVSKRNVYAFKTSMHSSRMRTARFGGHCEQNDKQV